MELLVSLGIVSILASLALISVGHGKTAARQIQCASNLRQLGLAAHLYWDDHEGSTFRWRGPARPGGQLYWFGWLQSGQEGSRRFDPAQGALHAYLGGRGVELCPGLNYLQPRFKLKATGASFGYGYNLFLSAPSGQPPVNVNRLRNPAGIVFLADSAQINTFQAPASPDNPMIEEFYYINDTEPTVHFRHRETANSLFVDGHISRERPDPNSLDHRLPDQTIGRLSSDLLVER